MPRMSSGCHTRSPSQGTGRVYSATACGYKLRCTVCRPRAEWRRDLAVVALTTQEDVMRYLMGLALLVSLLAGCAAPPPMSRAEFMALTTRQYSDISPEELYAAAEELFRISEPGYRFAHNDSGMQAVYNSFGGPIAWTLVVSRAGAGVRVQVSLLAPGAPGFAPVFLPGGGLGVGATPGGGVPAVGTSSYDIFWARLDYLLGKRGDWMTCAQSNERLVSGVVSGGPAALCGSRLFYEPRPEGPVVKPR